MAKDLGMSLTGHQLEACSARRRDERASPGLSCGKPPNLSPLLLEDVGVLGSRELLAGGDLHHICIELEPVAVGVKEVE